MANNKDREQILEEKLKKIKEELSVIKKKNMAKKRKERTREMCIFAGNIEKSFRKVFGQNLWGQPDRKDQIAFMENTLLKLFESYKQENKELPALVVDKPKPEEKKAPEPPQKEPENKSESFSFLDEDDDLEDLEEILGKKSSPPSF